jgi:hypothetical protein
MLQAAVRSSVLGTGTLASLLFAFQPIYEFTGYRLRKCTSRSSCTQKHIGDWDFGAFRLSAYEFTGYRLRTCSTI